MKNVKFLAVALIAAMMLMGAAYAARWTDATAYNATVNTGYLEVKITDSIKLPRIAQGSSNVEVTPIAITGEKTASVTFSNAYPGATLSMVNLLFKNTGSIPVKLGSIVYDKESWLDITALHGMVYTSDPLNGVGSPVSDWTNVVLQPNQYLNVPILGATVNDSAPQKALNGKLIATFNWIQSNP